MSFILSLQLNLQLSVLMFYWFNFRCINIFSWGHERFSERWSENMMSHDVFSWQKQKMPQIPFSTRHASTVGFVSGWFCVPKHQLQTAPPLLLLSSFCSTVCTSLLWLWSWARRSWNTGLWLVCHSVVWMHHMSVPSLPFLHLFSLVWPECSCRFMQRLGNTRIRLSLHDNTLQHTRASTVSPPWEARPPRNHARARQTQNTDCLLQRKTRRRRWLGSYELAIVCLCVCN